jgi:hypothetical protein
MLVLLWIRRAVSVPEQTAEKFASIAVARSEKFTAFQEKPALFEGRICSSYMMLD